MNRTKAHRNAHMKCRHVRSCRARPKAAFIFCVILLRRSPKVGMTPPGSDRTSTEDRDQATGARRRARRDGAGSLGGASVGISVSAWPAGGAGVLSVAMAASSMSQTFIGKSGIGRAGCLGLLTAFRAIALPNPSGALSPCSRPARGASRCCCDRCCRLRFANLTAPSQPALPLASTPGCTCGWSRAAAR